MTKEFKKILDSSITIWWWNHGEKKKDFEGTYREWFELKEISIIESANTVHFKGSFGSMQFSIKMNKHYDNVCNKIIQYCMTYLGDKALLRDCYNREFKINWR